MCKIKNVTYINTQNNENNFITRTEFGKWYWNMEKIDVFRKIDVYTDTHTYSPK